MIYVLYRLSAWLLYYTHEAIGYPLFSVIAWLAYLRGGMMRQTITRNVQRVIGAQASDGCVRRAVRESYRNLMWGYYELFHLPAFPQAEIRRRMTIAGLEHIGDGIAQGKGVLLATLHYGNTEVLLQVPLLFPQWKFIVLVEKMRDARVFNLIRRLRESQGMEMVPVDEPLKIMRRLKQNCVVGIACDRDVTHSGVAIDFFGAPARLPDGPVRLAMRTGAALLPSYGWREQDGRFEVRVLPPIELQRTGNFDCDVRANMENLYCVFEHIIRERPGQWMAFYPLWQ